MFFHTPVLLSTDLSGIGNIVTIASVVFTVIVAAILVVCALIGRSRGFLHSLLRLGAVALSALLSLLLTFLLKGVVGNLLAPLTEGLTEGKIPAELAEASPTLASLLSALPGALLAPFLFTLIFFFVNLIFLIVYKIVKKLPVFGKVLIPKKIGGKVSADRLAGLGVSIVCGLFLTVFFVLPLSGYASLADSIVTQLEKADLPDEELVDTLRQTEDNLTGPLSRNPVFVTANALTGKAIFNGVSSISTDSGKIVWEKELATLFRTYGGLTPLIETEFDFSRFEAAQADALRKLPDNLDGSVLMTRVAADVLPYAAATWNRGESFLGVSDPASSAPEMLQPLVGNIFTVLETTTAETLKDDLVTVADILATLAESGTLVSFADGGSAKDILNTLSQPGVISGMIESLNANEHMRDLVGDLANLGFDAISEALDIPKEEEERYNELKDDLNAEIAKTENLSDYDEKITVLSAGIRNVFEKYGVPATEEETNLYAECLAGIGRIA